MMLRSALSQLRAHPGRFAAVCLAIVLGVGFASSTLIFTDSYTHALTRSVAADTSAADVVVDLETAPSLDIAAIEAVPGVAAVAPQLTAYPTLSGPTSRGSLQLNGIPAEPALRWYTVDSGILPTGTDRIAVDRGTAERNRLEVGSTLTLSDPDGLPRDLTVTAVLDTGRSSLTDSSDAAYGSSELLASFGADYIWRALVLADSGTDATQLAATLTGSLGDGLLIRTGDEVGAQAVRGLTEGSNLIAIILLCFAALAGLVAAMVVANTFTILITQRQRQIALLRCIGATGGQVRRSGLAEAGLLAVIGSVLGVAVGIGVGRIAVGVAGIEARDFTVGTLGLAVVGVVGIAVTVIAALAPTARAMRIPPIAALRPVSTADRAKAVGLVRNIIGGIMLLGGGALLAGGAYLGDLLVAMAGGGITAVGVLLLLRSVLPYVLRFFGGLGRLAGTPGKLAVANGVRNPARAAATCTALVVGIGAIVTLQVAAASATAGADASLSQSRPLDLQIAAQESLPAGLADALAGIDGVATVETVLGADITYREPGSPDAAGEYRAYGVTPGQVRAVLLAGDLPTGTMAVPSWLGADAPQGSTFTVGGSGRELTLTMSGQKITDDGSFTLAADDLSQLAPQARPLAVWLKFTEDASPNAIISDVNGILAQYPDLAVSGSGPERAELEETLDTLIAVALALLAVAVVIAVVGIGNTLGLSVVERTRESALLRALGLRRRQLRLMLAIEALLLAVVAAVVGIVFGVLFGFAAAAAAFGEAGEDVVLTVPWTDLALVLVGALVAGVLASILPARRAASATPTQALAEV